MPRKLHFLPFLLATTLHAQQEGATVSGTVICDDTGRPAHLAKVYLSSAEPSHAGEKMMHDMEAAMQKSLAKSGETRPTPNEQQRKQQQQAAQRLNGLADLLSGTNAGLDGSYRITGVKSGTYYLHAQVPGYVDPYAQLSPEDFSSTDMAVRSRIAALPTVRIAGPTESPSVALHLQRGGVLSGKVTFDDGAPAPDWTVWALRSGEIGDADLLLSPSMQGSAAKEMGKPVSMTNDRGSFRIAGLADGTYVLRADIGALPQGLSGNNASQAGTGVRIAVYSGNVLLAGAAKSIDVHQGEERADVDLVIPSKSMHTLAGRVTASSDGHPLNMGNVRLSSKQDSHLQAKASVRRDGTFEFQDLPGNVTYTLTLDDGADATYSPEKESVLGLNIALGKATQKYAHAVQDVVLATSDNLGVQLSLNPLRETPGK
ncbi:MAG: hypothetical protein ACRYGF_13035 [Janthinobacterium lividum]